MSMSKNDGPYYIVHETDRRRVFKIKDIRAPYYRTVVEYCYGGRAGTMDDAMNAATEACMARNRRERERLAARTPAEALSEKLDGFAREMRREGRRHNVLMARLRNPGV